MARFRFVDLPGVADGELEGGFASSSTGLLRALKTDRLATVAGEHGAVIVWIDDAGTYRCEFCRDDLTLEEQVFDAKAQVREWLSAWLPKLTG